MSESERLERAKRHTRHDCDDCDLGKEDEELSDRIRALLNNDRIDKHCMVDAYYYDFSVIPREIQERLNIGRDAYLIYGITTDGEIVFKWVDRWDLDSSNEIIDGKVIHPEEKELSTSCTFPEITRNFNKNLLSVPTMDFNIFWMSK